MTIHVRCHRVQCFSYIHVGLRQCVICILLNTTVGLCIVVSNRGEIKRSLAPHDATSYWLYDLPRNTDSRPLRVIIFFSSETFTAYTIGTFSKPSLTTIIAQSEIDWNLVSSKSA